MFLTSQRFSLKALFSRPSSLTVIPAAASACCTAVATSGLVWRFCAVEWVRVTVTPSGKPASASSCLALAGSPVFPAGKWS